MCAGMPQNAVHRALGVHSCRISCAGMLCSARYTTAEQDAGMLKKSCARRFDGALLQDIVCRHAAQQSMCSEHALNGCSNRGDEVMHLYYKVSDE
eukprot:1160397-Pelagomonas_calceolata.AAC.4